jgi:branched-chain amino acid transport system substrate-binding protein
VRKALEAAKFDAVRGAFRFNTNHFPIQDYYLRVVTKDAQGRITNRTLGTVFKNHADAYASACKMPS